jgi:formylglycine-generating enzyme required for sulfatase activity
MTNRLSILASLLILQNSFSLAAQADKPTTAPAAFTAYTERIPHTTVKFDMLPIPAGKIKFATDAKSPPREIQIKRFWMAKTECTWQEYQVWMFRLDLAAQERTEFFKTHPSRLHPRHPLYDVPQNFSRPEYPALALTSDAAKTYCEWLSKLTGKKYRLPTEAEWEYVCRAGGEIIHFDKPTILNAAWCAENSAEGNEDGDPMEHPVGKKKPNPWGFYDLLGNLGEWCTTIDGKSAVLRGGSYLTKASDLHLGHRAPFDPEWQSTDPQDPKSKWWLSDAPFAGFRIVREE